MSRKGALLSLCEHCCPHPPIQQLACCAACHGPMEQVGDVLAIPSNSTIHDLASGDLNLSSLGLGRWPSPPGMPYGPALDAVLQPQPTWQPAQQLLGQGPQHHEAHAALQSIEGPPLFLHHDGHGDAPGLPTPAGSSPPPDSPSADVIHVASPRQRHASPDDAWNAVDGDLLRESDGFLPRLRDLSRRDRFIVYWRSKELKWGDILRLHNMRHRFKSSPTYNPLLSRLRQLERKHPEVDEITPKGNLRGMSLARVLQESRAT